MPTTFASPNPSSAVTVSRAKCLSFLKSRQRSYAPWRKPMSETQINAYFERQIMPELTALLKGAFQGLPDSDREEAIQDATCQALEAYRTLRLHENIRRDNALDETALVLAKFASSQYLGGVRFANPRSHSLL